MENNEQTTLEEIKKIYEELTPENQDKVNQKIISLLLEEGKLFHIKANLQTCPTDENTPEQQKSCGEGVFVLVYADAKQAYDNDEQGTLYPAILDNDCIMYPELKHGTRLPIITNGEFRPYVPYSWLIERYAIAEEIPKAQED